MVLSAGVWRVSAPAVAGRATFAPGLQLVRDPAQLQSARRRRAQTPSRPGVRGAEPALCAPDDGTAAVPSHEHLATDTGEVRRQRSQGARNVSGVAVEII